MDTYDFVVAGGSIAGLAFAAEAAKKGAKVVVFEEHEEIGEPEKCDGLVSLRGLRKYGYLPREGVIQNEVGSALVHSPDGRETALNATTMEVVVLDRSAFDKQVAESAAANGAIIQTGSRVTSPVQGPDGVEAKTKGAAVRGKYFIDATGPASSPRRGILPAAKYEIEADWVREHVVELFPDAERYPGFFAWVIPYGSRRAKVGAAGFGINPFKALDRFLEDRPCEVLRKVSAPIYIGGPRQRFASGRTIFVGESAGQVKPTTAGGIMTSIAGAAAAARWAWGAVQRDEPGLVGNYQLEWERAFLKEMKNMLRLRGVFEKLSNADLDALSELFASPRLAQKLSRADFDFHASAILGALGVQGLLRVARVVASAEARSLLTGG
ncbi:MAG: geranylgeranyl reductase family protein [Nitrososphaerota archaeon]|nr:geranylgeranyl reductase family protein [Nitrososphaerota archaeon]MDG7024264.1 geranylgeranyl reductase family protein [Nitrososphaerota archaeon]